MIDKIDDAIRYLAVDINSLTPLEGNARIGDVDAIKASYNKFGQLKPIVAVRDLSGKVTVIAGNHQLAAAKELGWDEIAVSIVDLNEEDAIAFSLADNRISELGEIDKQSLYDLISDVSQADPEFFDLLGWDDFAVTAIENSVIQESRALDSNEGWQAPQIIVSPQPDDSDHKFVDELPDSGEGGKSFNPTSSTEDIVTQGSTVTPVTSNKKVTVQYTLVFEDTNQQREWYDFLRHIKSSDKYSGDTSAEQILDFINQNMDQ